MHDALQREVAAWRSQLRKGTLELAVLVLLRKKRRYGLELVELLNAANLGISEGSIYPLLSRLKTEKKVESEWVEEQSGHARKYYRLSESGQATCKAMLAAWADFTSGVDRLFGDPR
jgi:PadR family transcriptional regulator, regulatory protein PadR